MSTRSKKHKPSPEARRRNALRQARQALSDARLVQANVRVNRSTRTRSAYKIKAEALDRVTAILEGRE